MRMLRSACFFWRVFNACPATAIKGTSGINGEMRGDHMRSLVTAEKGGRSLTFFGTVRRGPEFQRLSAAKLHRVPGIRAWELQRTVGSAPNAMTWFKSELHMVSLKRENSTASLDGAGCGRASNAMLQVRLTRFFLASRSLRSRPAGRASTTAIKLPSRRAGRIMPFCNGGQRSATQRHTRSKPSQTRARRASRPHIWPSQHQRRRLQRHGTPYWSRRGAGQPNPDDGSHDARAVVVEDDSRPWQVAGIASELARTM